ncbi:MAG: phosphatidylserine/phosphatidylglycerophosphate/cardiolipin synthase family protein [Bacteriovorax sp.]|nr:phosphatidylserine/phosphatidylglycerophosphate/cardiolipin synthase family protein [Bacteriovorax sp.]
MKYLIFFISIFTLNLKAGELDPFRASIRSNHQITLLNQGLASLEERLQMIEKAQKSIAVEYFIYNLDKSGRIFSQALIKKAREGVKVRMLLDYFMVKGQFSPFFAYEMEKNGIEVKYFNATSTLNLFGGQYRNHRKLLLIDGKEAITGGRNIGDEYFDLHEKFNFLDRDILVSGPIVSSIQNTFDQVWNADISVKVERDRMPQADDGVYRIENNDYDEFRYSNDLKHYNQEVTKAVEFLSVPNNLLLEEIRAKGKAELATEYSGICERMSFNSEYPIIGKKNRAERIIKHDLAGRIRNAKESILFDSPYFIVDDASTFALDYALENKVKVTLLTNSLNSTDAIYVYASFDSNIKNWIKKGLDTYIFKGNLPENYATMTDEISHARFGVHAKSFVFDKKDVVIGTYNFDPRSANLNVEMTLSCDNNPKLAGIVTEDIEARMRGSIFLDSNKTVDDFQFYNTSFLKRIGYYLYKIPSNLFDYLL